MGFIIFLTVLFIIGIVFNTILTFPAFIIGTEVDSCLKEKGELDKDTIIFVMFEVLLSGCILFLGLGVAVVSFVVYLSCIN